MAKKKAAKAGPVDNGARVAAEKAAASGGGKCAVCFQQFATTAKPAVFKAHADAKHPKEDFAKCFPGVTL